MPYRFNPFSQTLDYYPATAAITADFKSNQAVNEAPNGSRTVFTTPDTYLPATLTVYLNGLHESNFTETTTNSFTFDTAPATGDVIKVSYGI